MGNKYSKIQGGFGAIGSGLSPKRNGIDSIFNPRQNGTTDAFNRSLAGTRRKFDPLTNGLRDRRNASIAKTNRDLDFVFNNKVKNGLNHWFVEEGKYSINLFAKNVGLRQPFEGQRPAGLAGLLSPQDGKRWEQTVTFGSFFSGIAEVSSVVAPFIPVIDGEAPPFTIPGVGEVDLGGSSLGGIGGGGISGGQVEQKAPQAPTNTVDPGMTLQERLGYAVLAIGGGVLVCYLFFNNKYLMYNNV